MKLVLDELGLKENFYPFSSTRNVADMRIGIMTIREKWEAIFGVSIECRKVPAEEHDVIRIPSNCIPRFSNKEGTPPAIIVQNCFIIEHPWDIFKLNDVAIREDFKIITKGRTSKPLSSTNNLIGDGEIFIEDGAVVEYATLNTSTGPIYIGKNATIMEGSLIRGPFALCEGAVVKMGAKIYGATTIGPYSNVCGEIKNSVIFGYSNKAHDGYLGDSVIGEWCNLGAGTSNSNIKNTAGDVKVWSNSKKDWDNAGTKCGLLMGDYSRAAINTSFNTGSIVGVCCNIFGEIFPPKYIGDFSWGKEKYSLDKALKDIDNWKKLKDKTITSEEEKLLSDIYQTTKK